MLSSKMIKPITALAAVLMVSAPVDAHRAWIKPSETVLSGEQNYVTFDAAVSNTLFFPDHVALRTDGVVAYGPDGQTLAIENAARGKYRSVFDLALNKEGTYKIASASAGLRAFWRDEQGNRQMWPPRGRSSEGQTFEQAVPKDAKDLRVMYSSRRIETFVTLGAPSEEALKPTNQGLELVPVTHPNDLYATEAATFRFLIDGEPAKGVEIEITPGAMRYRNAPEDIKVTTDAKGEFTVTWPKAAMYFLEASYKDDKAKAPATERTGGYSATLEVLPL